MLLLVSGATRDVIQADPRRVGVLFVPGNYTTRHASGRIYAIDNGAFTRFDANAYMEILDRCRGLTGCRFVVAPDVVGDAAETLRLFDLWEPMIRGFGYPVALAAQDGLTPERVPWSRLDALFIGGTTQWKLSAAVDTLLGVAAAHGKWRHIGRVNSLRRMRHFATLCDSIDGSSFSRAPRIRIAKFNQWADALQRQPLLFR